MSTLLKPVNGVEGSTGEWNARETLAFLCQ